VGGAASAAGVDHPVVDDGLDDRADLVVGQPAQPSSVTDMTTGQILRVRSGPPVAESSSAAS
jgi:hypothetical protein